LGKPGAKIFIFAHKSANPLELATAITRGAFEYQGQKCSAASRAYIPESLWEETRAQLLKFISEIQVGGVKDFGNFVNAVIDESAFNNIMNYIEKAQISSSAEIIAGGKGDKQKAFSLSLL